VIKRKI